MNGEPVTPNQAEPPEAIYTALVAVRNTELTAYWARNNILAAINLGLLAVAFAGRHDSFAINHSVVVGVFGTGLSVLWLLFIHEGKKLITERWEPQIQQYESTIANAQHRLFTNARAAEAANPLAAWSNLTIFTIFLPCISIAAWIAFMVLNGCA